MNIYVGNLSYEVEEYDLKGIFEEYGKVNSVRVIMDKFTGRSKGFAFVEMENKEEAEKAINGLNGGSLVERKLVVNEARERSN